MSTRKATHVDGDVQVENNVAVGGDGSISGGLTVGHNLKVEGWLEARNIRGVNKGVFPTYEALVAKYPVPQDGWYAGVAVTTDGETVFRCYVARAGQWTDTGGMLESAVEFVPLQESVNGLQDKVLDIRSAIIALGKTLSEESVARADGDEELQARILGTSLASDATSDPFRKWPGALTSWEDVVHALDALMSISGSEQGKKAAGRWRLVYNGRVIHVDMYAQDFEQGYWVQVVSGALKIEANNGQIVFGMSNEYHSYFRRNFDGFVGTIGGAWTETTVDDRLRSLSRQPNCGLFASAAALNAAYPSPLVGMWAMVGDTIPAEIYRCQTAGTWTATGETGGGGSVELDDYVTLEDYEAGIEEQHSDLLSRLQGISALSDATSDPFRKWPGELSSWGDVVSALYALMNIRGLEQGQKAAGRWRLVYNGRVIHVDMYAQDFEQGYWVQVVSGAIKISETSATGFELGHSNTPHTYWRRNFDGFVGDIAGVWCDISDERTYNPTAFSGSGYRTVAKNLSGGVNLLTSSAFVSPNTTYVIRYDFDLGGGTLTVPEGCTLDFQGGSIRNGTLVGLDTRLTFNAPFLYGVRLSGTFRVKGECKDTSIFLDSEFNTARIESMLCLYNESDTLLFSEHTYVDVETITLSRSVRMNFGGSTIRLLLEESGLPVTFITTPRKQMSEEKYLDFVEIGNVSIVGNTEYAYDGTQAGANKHVGLYRRVIELFKVSEVTLRNVHLSCCEVGSSIGSGTLTPVARHRYELSNISVVYYDRAVIEGLVAHDCYADGIVHLIPDEGENHAIVKGCVSYRNYTTFVSLVDGKCAVTDNKVSDFNSSAMNLFCYDSLIANNEFSNGQRSVCIDLSEQGKFFSRNVVVRENYGKDIFTFCEAAGDGIFLTANRIYSKCDTESVKGGLLSVAPGTDTGEVNPGFVNNASVEYGTVCVTNNICYGCSLVNSILSSARPLTTAHPETLVVSGNYSECHGAVNYSNPLMFGAIDNVYITDNVIRGRGKSWLGNNLIQIGLNFIVPDDWDGSFTPYIYVKDNVFIVDSDEHNKQFLIVSSTKETSGINLYVDIENNIITRPKIVANHTARLPASAVHLTNLHNVNLTNASQSLVANVYDSGATSDRPSGSCIKAGFQYFDTDLGKPVYAKAISSSGSTVTWVDASGTQV